MFKVTGDPLAFDTHICHKPVSNTNPKIVRCTHTVGTISARPPRVLFLAITDLRLPLGGLLFDVG